MKYLLLPAMLVFSSFLGAQSASYFINEISYAASNPTEKGFEIVGEAGSQLDGWSVVQYDAEGWEQQVVDLSNQIIPNQQNGYGTIWYDIEQGGNSGGLALVNPSGSIVQFVAYGPLNGADLLSGALNGIAAGVIPQYIGAVTADNKAMQLIGIGNLYPTFFWVSTQTASLGQINDNQLFLFGLFSTSTGGNELSEAVTSRQQTTAVEGQANFEDAPEALVWPNPTTDFIQVSLPELREENTRLLCLYDQNGRQLIRQQVSNAPQQVQLDLGSLPAGLYYLTVFSKDNQWQHEVVIN